MRIRPFRVLLVLALLVSCSAVLLAYLAFDRQPAIVRTTEFTPDNIERAKRIVESNDPRRLRSGAVRTVRVTAEDLDLAFNYLAHRYAEGSARATLQRGRLQLVASVAAARLPFSPFVNITADLVQGAPIPSIARIQVGQLRVPVAVAWAFAERAVSTALNAEDQQTITQAIRGIEFDTAEARLTYQWHSDLADTVRGALIPPDHRQRLELYQRTLADATKTLPPGDVSLIALLKPLFALAVERSGVSDAVTENRAAILVLTTYVLGMSLNEIVPEAAEWPRPRRRVVTLNRRDDSGKHFMVSAMLSANTGGPFADAVGVYKEVSDSQGGSGFSFNDLAADRAGRRLGELAEQPSTARRLMQQLSAVNTERTVMPDASDLTESMSEKEFIRRFGGLTEPRYLRMVADIDKRIDGLALYR